MCDVSGKCGSLYSFQASEAPDMASRPTTWSRPASLMLTLTFSEVLP